MLLSGSVARPPGTNFDVVERRAHFRGQLLAAACDKNKMAEERESLVSVATWRVLTLFLFIVAIDLICEFGNEAITHHFRHKQQSGLLHAWEQLKFETMALGLVSLLLIIGEVRDRFGRGSVRCLMGGLRHVLNGRASNCAGLHAG